MLRISSDPSTSNKPSRATATAPSTKAAAGNCSADAPTVSGRSPEKKSRQVKMTGNHAAKVLPWITEEIRFHSVLDLGCSDGEAVRLLQDAGYDAYGIDLAPKELGLPKIIKGDFFESSFESDEFDLVICCNVLQEIPNHEIPSLLAEINRLSNSYVMITTPSTEADAAEGLTRDIAWWTDRIRDFGWRYRIIREDAETGQMIILAEKHNSLASQILPLLDDGVLPQNGTIDQPVSKLGVEVTQKIDLAIADFATGDLQSGFNRISEIADLLMNGDQNLDGIRPLFARIVAAMESRDDSKLIDLLRNELKPAITGL